MEAFDKLEVKLLNDQIYYEIRRAIVSGDIPPGERLVVSELASTFGTSLTPVKEAVAKLETQGLVQIQPRVGTFVSHLKSSEVKELFDVRLMIELYAAEKNIERVTKKDISRLQQLVDDLSNHVDGDKYLNFHEYIEKDQLFHQYFVEICGNQRLLDIFKDLCPHIMITRAYHVKCIRGAERAHKEHKLIVQNLKDHDIEALRKTLREHINQGMKNVLDAMKGFIKDGEE